jgi:hypothetical protein
VDRFRDIVADMKNRGYEGIFQVHTSVRCHLSNSCLFPLLSTSCTIIRDEVGMLEMDVPCYGSQSGMVDDLVLCYLHCSE